LVLLLVSGCAAVVPLEQAGSLSSYQREAVDPAGNQKAAMVWARGADSLTTKPRVSSAGDAYVLASSFGNDFSALLVTGSDPFKALPSMPSMQRVQSMLGGAPKQKACEAFGRGAGLTGLVGGAIGLPPRMDGRRRAGGSAEVAPSPPAC
jgi:hypothetical protein